MAHCHTSVCLCCSKCVLNLPSQELAWLSSLHKRLITRCQCSWSWMSQGRVLSTKAACHIIVNRSLGVLAPQAAGLGPCRNVPCKFNLLQVSSFVRILEPYLHNAFHVHMLLTPTWSLWPITSSESQLLICKEKGVSIRYHCHVDTRRLQQVAGVRAFAKRQRSNTILQQESVRQL